MITFKDIPRWIIAVVALIILGLAIWYFLNILIYILVAGILSLIGRPLVDLCCRIKLGRFRVSRSLGAVLTIAGMGIIVAALVAIFIPLISTEASRLSKLDLNEVVHSLDEPIARTEAFLSRYQLVTPDDDSLSIVLKKRLQEIISITNVSNAVNAILGFVGSFVVAIFSITFILFFFLRDQHLFFRMIKAVTPPKQDSRVEQVYSSIRHLLRRYFIGILLQVAAGTICLSIALYIIGVEDFFLIAFIAAILNIVPYVGPILGAIIGITLGITTNLQLDFYSEMVPFILKIAAVFGSMQLLDNLILQPLIYSNSVKAHPLEIFLVILAAGTLGGIVGMIIAIPAYTVIRVIAKEFLGEFRLVQDLTKDM